MTDRTSGHERWAVVGGGFLGASLAMQLAERGYHVDLLEARDHIGGLADGWSIELTDTQVKTSDSPNGVSDPVSTQVSWDRFYHVILMSDLRLRTLLEQLQLHDNLQWRRTRTGFYTDGVLHSMSNSLEFLKFPPLKLIDKCRLALTIVVASRIRDWRKLESISVTDWLRRWSGKTTLDKIWRPLLKAKLGALYTQTSAAFIWSTINRMYAARRSGLKEEMFGYVDGGYAVIGDALQRHLIEKGIHVRTACKVTQVVSQQPETPSAQASGANEHRVAVTLADGKIEEYNSVIIAAHAPLIVDLAPHLTATEVQTLDAISYLGVVCVSVVLREPLAGFYVTNITDEWVPFTGVIEMSALVDSTQLQGRGLVYLPKYVACDDALFDRSDADISQEFITAFKAMYRHLNDDDIVAVRVARARQVMAVPTLNYSSMAPSVTTSVDGLYIASTAQILFGTLNVNETLLLADTVMRDIDNDLASDKPTQPDIS